MIPLPAVIAITDSARGDFERWLAQLEILLAEAAPERVLVMLRDRQLEARERLALGRRLRELTRRHQQRLSVNDRLDLAVLLEADAIHLSESSVASADARAFGRRSGRAFWISRASHQPDEIASTDADALLLAPAAEARKGRPALGVAGFEQARAERERRARDRGACALYALGGISSACALDYVQAGADGVALIGALREPGEPRALIERLGLRR